MSDNGSKRKSNSESDLTASAATATSDPTEERPPPRPDEGHYRSFDFVDDNLDDLLAQSNAIEAAVVLRNQPAETAANAAVRCSMASDATYAVRFDSRFRELNAASLFCPCASHVLNRKFCE